jgi:hypothetical protein
MSQVIGRCAICPNGFKFDPATVYTVWIDSSTGLPLRGGGRVENAKKEPVCPNCIEFIGRYFGEQLHKLRSDLDKM